MITKYTYALSVYENPSTWAASTFMPKVKLVELDHKLTERDIVEFVKQNNDKYRVFGISLLHKDEE